MGKFATGKRSLAISDRSGQAFPYSEMVKEWNGSLVHISEFEAKHPQLDPGHHPADAIALKDPRPARQEPVTVFVDAPGDSSFESNGMQPATQSGELLIGSSIGTVSVVIS